MAAENAVALVVGQRQRREQPLVLLAQIPAVPGKGALPGQTRTGIGRGVSPAGGWTSTSLPPAPPWARPPRRTTPSPSGVPPGHEFLTRLVKAAEHTTVTCSGKPASCSAKDRDSNCDAAGFGATQSSNSTKFKDASTSARHRLRAASVSASHTCSICCAASGFPLPSSAAIHHHAAALIPAGDLGLPAELGQCLPQRLRVSAAISVNIAPDSPQPGR